jgi:hypothetical protein
MKFSTIALALSTIVAPSMGEYVCHTDAFFTFDHDNATPSKDAQKFLGLAMVDAFNEAYASVDDITMDGDAIETVSNYIFCFTFVVVVAACASISASFIILIFTLTLMISSVCLLSIYSYCSLIWEMASLPFFVEVPTLKAKKVEIKVAQAVGVVTGA